MRDYVPRAASETVLRRLRSVPVVTILGPRQCGKSTLARRILAGFSEPLYLDLERPADLRRLSDPEALFALNEERLICIDEVQRRPDLFPVIRYWVDRSDRPGQFLLLGSASPDLLRQGSETLAGRISFVELTPFLLPEIAQAAAGGGGDVQARPDTGQLHIRGGFPRSYLAADDGVSVRWREDFVRTYLERDLPALGIQLRTEALRHFWTMLAHAAGSTMNYAKFAESLGLSHTTVRRYTELLSRTWMIRLVPAYTGNVKKRIVKAPKIYLRDTGILHALLEIPDGTALLGHPGRGASWESFVVEQILSSLQPRNASFYRSEKGAELDLLFRYRDRLIAVEAKSSTAPEVTRGFWSALEVVRPDETWVVAPVDDPYPLRTDRNVWVADPLHLIRRLAERSPGPSSSAGEQ